MSFRLCPSTNRSFWRHRPRELAAPQKRPSRRPENHLYFLSVPKFIAAVWWTCISKAMFLICSRLAWFYAVTFRWGHEHVAAFLSLEGHPLIVPKPHFIDIFELDEIHAAAIMKAAVRVARATKTTMGCDGINLVQSNGAPAGQDVFHFHLHIKPRFTGDDVTMTWDTRAIEEAVREDTSDAISRQLTKIP